MRKFVLASFVLGFILIGSLVVYASIRRPPTISSRGRIAKPDEFKPHEADNETQSDQPVEEEKTILAASVIVNSTLTPGSEPFRINITVADVQKLWGYEFILRYQTSVLTATNFGIYLPFKNMISTVSKIDDIEGNVYIVAFIELGYHYGLTVTNQAPIAWIEFILDGEGNSPLDLRNSKLSDPFGNPIPHKTVNGFFDMRLTTPP